MSTETLGGSRPNKGLRVENASVIKRTFINGSGVTLKEGDEVILKADGELDIRDAGTELPLGVVSVGGDDGEEVTVNTNFHSITTGNAVGATNAGVAVKPDGTRTNDLPDYVAAITGDLASAIMLNVTTGANEVAVLGHLYAPYTVPA